MKTAIASGESDPDLMYVHSRWNRDFVGKGVLVDITDYVDKDQFSPNLLSGVSWEGKLYGIPYEVSTLVWYHRPDALELAGVAYPNSTLDYLKMGKKLRRLDKYADIFDQAADNSNTFIELCLLFGGDVFTMKGDHILDKPEGHGVEAADFFLQISKFARNLGHQSPEGFTAIKNGEVVGNMIQYSWIHRMKDALKDGDEPFGKWRIGVLPQKMGVGVNKATYGPLTVFVNKKSDNIRTAIEVAKFFSHSEDGLVDLANKWMVMGAYRPGLKKLQTASVEWPIFGGQKVQGFLGQNIMDKKLAVTNPNKNLAEAQAILGDHLSRMFKGEFAPEEMVKLAAKKIKEALE